MGDCGIRKTNTTSLSTAVSMRRIVKTWWPLAASWLLMGLEGPAISAVIARLANPEINLAAYGGVVFPLTLFIEAPIIMLLAASTALDSIRDRVVYGCIKPIEKLNQLELAKEFCVSVRTLREVLTILAW